MRVVGIIAEYNPFHLGHAHHLAEARRLANADAVVVVMSSVFTQRGDAAVLSPIDRARMALSCGADAVFALPAVWAVRDAEHFALGGVSLLASLGCDALSFGTETIDLPLLKQTAALLEHPDSIAAADLQAYLGKGLSFPAALSSALETVYPGCGRLLAQPNSTLAICYLRAMLRLQTDMTVVPVQRIGEYHDSALGDGLPSATALRGAILRGDWGSVRSSIPESTFSILRQAALHGHLHRPDALDYALLYRLRTMSSAEYASLPDISEGIERRLQSAAETSFSRENLLQSAKTRRYPYARFSRMATHALLGLTDDALKAQPLPEAAWLLGFRRDAGSLMTYLKSKAHVPIISKAADWDRSQPWFAAEIHAYDVWALGAGLPSALAFTQGVAIL